MKENNEIIPIFFSTDNNYLPYLDVAIRSLVENASKEYRYKIIVLNTGLDEDKTNKIKTLENENFTIDFKDITYAVDRIKDNLKNLYHFSISTWYRLFIQSLFPEYKKALYLDCDIVVLGDISKLYFTDLKDNILGGVVEYNILHSPVFSKYTKEAIGVDSKYYINAGILVMDLEKFREHDIENNFVQLINKYNFNVIDPDQAYINFLCRDKIEYLPFCWNRTTLDFIECENPQIVHYALGQKPWFNEDMFLAEHFWKYAKQSPFYDEIMKRKQNYTALDKLKKERAGIDIQIHALECVQSQNTFYNKLIKNIGENNMEKAPDRVSIIEKIKQYEKQGLWNKDVEDDPETFELLPNKIDYLNKNPLNKIKTFFANMMGKSFFNKMLKNKQVIIENIVGIGNFKSVKGGAIITSNHFNPFDNYAIWTAIKSQMKGKKLYKIIREGNYTNPPKPFGFFMRHCNTLPLSSNMQTMRKFVSAIKTLLKRGEKILIYPEQAMWWNYRKPRPLKDGAFKLAVKNNVPVIPMFITMQDSELIGQDGFPIQRYTIHILKPIYPSADLDKKENIVKMKEENFAAWVETYEKFYKTKLTYEK